MNKEYTYIDGKAIIKDEKGNQTPIEYYDNLDEVLSQENLIEVMKQKINLLESQQVEYKKHSNKRYIPVILIFGLLISIIGFPTIYHLLGATDIYTSTINTIFGAVNEGVFYSTIVATLYLPVVCFVEFGMYHNYKTSKKDEKGINKQLDFLRQQLVKENEKLKELTLDKTKEKDNKKFRVVKVNSLQKLKELKETLELYYDLGFNDTKYSKYIEQGKLNDKLRKYYTENDIEIIRESLEESAPVLIKKKKHN